MFLEMPKSKYFYKSIWLLCYSLFSSSQVDVFMKTFMKIQHHDF